MFLRNLVMVAVVLVGAAQTASADTALYDFYTDTCQPCRMMAPTVARLAEAGYPIKKIDGNRHMDLIRRFGITAYPTFLMVVDDRETGRIVGMTDYRSLQNLCENGLRLRQARAPQPPARLPESINGAASEIPLSTRPIAELLQPQNAVVPASATVPAPYMPTASSVVRAVAEKIGRATVRIRVAANEGSRYGSGTIVDCRAGEALIITSSRLFAPKETPGRVDVDLFDMDRLSSPVEGRLLCRDDARGLALVGIRVARQITTVPVAPRGVELQANMQVISAGCDEGNAPSARATQVAAVGPYPATATSLRIAGRAVVGRAGGGLFDLRGRLIGVCNTNVDKREETYYVALGTLLERLDDSELSFVYNDPRNEPPTAAQQQQQPQWATNTNVPNVPETTNNSVMVPQSVEQPALSEIAGNMPLSDDERAALAHLIKLMRSDNEIVCVVRSRKDPSAQSQVLMLDSASPEFITRLMAESLAFAQRRHDNEALRGQNDISDPTQPKN